MFLYFKCRCITFSTKIEFLAFILNAEKNMHNLIDCDSHLIMNYKNIFNCRDKKLN